MKKLLSVALIAVVFGLAGCSAADKPSATVHQDSISNTNANAKAGTHHKNKCKGKKCAGKLGQEKVEQDTAK